MKVACYCGAVYTFTYDGSCPECGEEVFLAVKPPQQRAEEFADKMAGFVKTSFEIASLPEVGR